MKNDLNNDSYLAEMHLFYDINNQNNCFGIFYYDDFLNGQREEFVFFKNKEELESIVNGNITRINTKKPKIYNHLIRFHLMENYVNDLNSRLNRSSLSYSEIINGKYLKKSIGIPSELEDKFLQMIKISKNIPLKKETDLEVKKIYHLKREIVDISNNLKRTYSEVSDKVSSIDREKVVKRLKIVCATTLIASIFIGGFKLIRAGSNPKEFIKFINKPVTQEDQYVINNHQRAVNIILNIVNDKSDLVSVEDLDFLIEYFRQMNVVNHDRNKSSLAIHYEQFYHSALYETSKFSYSGEDLLKKIDALYNDCFIDNGKTIVINESAARDYLKYVLTLTVAYDFDKKDDNDYGRLGTGFATRFDVEEYNSLPTPFKCMILYQAKTLASKTKFKFDVTVPKVTYSWGTNTTISSKIDSLIQTEVSNLYQECGYKQGKKH